MIDRRIKHVIEDTRRFKLQPVCYDFDISKNDPEQRRYGI